MKKLALAALAATTLLATPAAAQTNWTGFYVGVNAGYADGQSDQQGDASGRWDQAPDTAIGVGLSPFIDFRLDKADGAVFGAQAGFNYQVDSVVFGVEVDYTRLSLEDVAVRGPTAIPPSAFPFTATTGVDAKHMFTARGKLGVAFGNTLAYAHGGWAWVNVDFLSALTATNGYNKLGGSSKTEGGWIAGAGVEQKLTSQISVRAEYSFTDLGGADWVNGFVTGSCCAPPGTINPTYVESYHQEMRIHFFKLGVNFHF